MATKKKTTRTATTKAKAKARSARRPRAHVMTKASKARTVGTLQDLFNALDADGFTVHTRYGVWDRKRQALKAAKTTAKKTAKKSAKRRG